MGKEFIKEKSVNVSIDGWTDFGLAEEIVVASAIKGAKKWAEVVAGESMRNCPVKSGTLMRSHTVTFGGLPDADVVYEEAKTGKPKIDFKQGGDSSIHISANTPYALRQHEEHQSKSKYLERAFDAHLYDANNYVNGEVAKTLSKEKHLDESVFRQKFPDLKYEDYKHLL